MPHYEKSITITDYYPFSYTLIYSIIIKIQICQDNGSCEKSYKQTYLSKVHKIIKEIFSKPYD